MKKLIGISNKVFEHEGVQTARNSDKNSKNKENTQEN
jgi:hypothetical protein